MTDKWFLSALAALLVGVGASGCGSTRVKPAMGQVRGTVTFDGKPVDKGRVTFSPLNTDGISGGTNAMGPIEPDGTYTLTTFNTGDGAIVGQHIVTVNVPSEDVAELNKPRPDGSIPYKLPKELIPRKYNDPKTSPLRNTVEAGENVLNLDLKK